MILVIEILGAGLKSLLGTFEMKVGTIFSDDLGEVVLGFWH